jgi:hypothetical protein
MRRLPSNGRHIPVRQSAKRGRELFRVPANLMVANEADHPQLNRLEQKAFDLLIPASN